MVFGHFAVGLAIRARYRKVPFLLILISVQLLDWIWLVLSLLGVESYQVIHSPRGGLHVNFTSVPYSHSLFWSAFYSLIVFLLFVRAEGQTHWAFPLALGVFSHWILDWIVIDEGLPFANFGAERIFGLGLANRSAFAEFAFELGIVLTCWWYYYKSGISQKARRWPVWIMLAIMVVGLLSIYLVQ